MDCDGSCAVFQVQPKRLVLHFDVNSDAEVRGKIKIQNIADVAQIVDVTPPLTDAFAMASFMRKGYVFPGEYIKLHIILKPYLMPRIYFDYVRVECSGPCPVEVVLEAIPKIPPLQLIPKTINFGHVELGTTVEKKVILPPRKVDLPFLLVPLEANPDLKIHPCRGTVSKAQQVTINVAYCPSRYVTLVMPVNVYLPTIIQCPYTITITAYTHPGHQKAMNPMDEPSVVIDKKTVKTVCPRFKTGSIVVKPIVAKKHIPLWSHHKTNVALRRIPCHDHPDELLGPLGRYLQEEVQIHKLKQKQFYKDVNQALKANLKSCFNTKAKLRDLEPEQFERERVWGDYLKDFEVRIPLNDRVPIYIQQRIVRRTSDPVFRGKPQETSANVWFPRYVAMSKFIEAGRRLIERQRLMKVLSILKELGRETVKAYEIVEEIEY